ncbi:hypothetical protein H6796_01640 [Candidatus Nomurabacteria bacterium]|nr:hypothetical protein [Candidatus Nomurabacteria bacterium]
MKKSLSRAFRTIDPRNISKKLNDRSIVQSFADNMRLVFFGHVDQNDEDQKVVKGVTVSRSHADQYYLIGNYKDYDVVFVERKDSVLEAHRRRARHTSHRWHIFQFDLKTPIDHPMIFISNRRHEESYRDLLATKFTNMRALPVSSAGGHSAEFAQNYHILSVPTYFIYTEQLITPEITDTIAKHFGHFAIEIMSNHLIIYSEGAKLSSGLLKTMLQNGTWLAEKIDARSHELQTL